MRDYEIHQLGKEIEVTVANGEMQLRVNGSSTFVRMPFSVGDKEISEIKTAYHELDRLATSALATDRQVSKAKIARDYREREESLGRRLNDILFRSPQDKHANQLATVFHHCLLGLHENEYVRLLLSFASPHQADLPWELALWVHPETGEQIYLGHDRRIALSRLDHGRSGLLPRSRFGADGMLSILNIGADESTVGKRHYELTRDFFRLIEDRIPRLRIVSRPSSELQQYWWDSAESTGEFPEFDIVHWRGHGASPMLAAPKAANDHVEISAAELVQRTRGAFLYVVLACTSGGQMNAPNDPAIPSFSSALLDAGAPVVIGIHDTVGQEAFGHLPILYPLLFQGLPLDYCVQYLRRFFALRNADTSQGLRASWHKLLLRTASTWYLDSTLASVPMARLGRPVFAVAALIKHFDRLIDERMAQVPAGVPGAGAAPVDKRELTGDLNNVVNRLYDAELLVCPSRRTT